MILRRVLWAGVSTLTLSGLAAGYLSSDRLLLVTDPEQTSRRFIKLVGTTGGSVNFAQTYSCDAKDCRPTQENIHSLSGPPSPSGTIRLERQNSHRSQLVWKRHPLDLRPMHVSATLYNQSFNVIHRSAQTRATVEFGSLRVVEDHRQLQMK